MRKLNGLSLIMISYLLLVFIVFASPAQAIDVTFRVPVELVNMPATITSGTVSCLAFVADRAKGVTYTNMSLGSGMTKFALRGNFNSTVDVVIRNYEKFPANGLGWSCGLSLYDTTVGSDTVRGTPAGVIMNKYTIDTSKPVKYEVSGIR